MVLYDFAKRLQTLKCKVFVSGHASSNPMKVPVIAQNRIDPESFIAIYPEIIVGNPFKTKRFAHWLLYFPSVNGGAAVYSKSEVLMTYGWGYASGIGAPRPVPPQESHHQVLVQVAEWGVKLYRDYSEKDATVSLLPCLFMVRKGHQFWMAHDLERKKLELESKGCVETKGLPPKQFCGLCTRRRVIYFLDPFSYYSVLASLCGCDSVTILPASMTSQHVHESFPLSRYGVAFGENDVGRARQTRKKLKDFVSCYENFSMASVKHFIHLSQNWDVNFS